MDIPNILKGHLYPSTRVSRCPRFHACVMCKKCQNFDPHQLDCQNCESRVKLMKPCEHLPEGEYVPDIQHSIKIMEKGMRKALASPDGPSQSVDVAKEMSQITQASNKLKRFANKTKMEMSEEIVHALVDDPDILGKFD